MNAIKFFSCLPVPDKKKAHYGIIEIIQALTNLTSIPPPPCKNKKSRATAGATFVNLDQVLGGGCNLGIADMRIYHNFWEGFKSADMLGDCRKSPKMANLAISHVMKSITYKYKISSFGFFDSLWSYHRF